MHLLVVGNAHPPRRDRLLFLCRITDLKILRIGVGLEVKECVGFVCVGPG
jgi:hypothetical protein